MSYDKCPFCDKGQAWRSLAWRIVKEMSRPDMQEILKEKRDLAQMRRRKKQ